MRELVERPGRSGSPTATTYNSHWRSLPTLFQVLVGGQVGRNHTFMDSEFGRPDYDANDRGEFDEGLVFVVMPFTGQEMDDTYEAIKDECRNIGLSARRVDEVAGSGFVIRQVTDLIERAEFLICDLTRERPNVYYELGYAHGVGNEGIDILLVAQEGTTLHFDIAPLRVTTMLLSKTFEALSHPI
jgi:hypothetical protein